MSILRDFWARLAGRPSASETSVVEADPVEYMGYRIRPAPFEAEGQYQVAGVIEKGIESDLKSHRFIRADRMASREEAVTFTILKAQQLIDQQGDRIFEQG